MRPVDDVEDPRELDPSDDPTVYVDEMDLSVGDLVVVAGATSPSAVMKVDAIDLGYVNFHYPMVAHPQDARYGGPGAFDQPLEEWYASWLNGELTPAELEVKV